MLTANLAQPKKQPTASTYNLESDLKDFFKLIPTYELLQLYRSFSNEKYVMNAFAYFKTDDIKSAIHALLNLEEIANVIQFMDSEQVPLLRVLNETVSRLGYEWWQTDALNASETNLIMHDFLEDATRLTYSLQVGNEFISKYLNSDVFRELVDKIKEVDTAKLQSSAVKLPIVQKVAIRLALLKVDIKELSTFIALQFLGDNLG